MENGVKVLSEYRFERAKEMLDAARQNLSEKDQPPAKWLAE